MDITGGLIVGALGLLFALTQRGKRRRHWQKAAEEVGLTQIVSQKRRLSGQAGELRVRMEEFQRHRQMGTRIVVGGLGHRPLDLTLRKESLGTALGRSVLGRGEIEIGDAAFDEAVSLQGSPELACALLDVETRGRVLRLMEGFLGSSVLLVERTEPTVVLADGELRVELIEKGGWYRAPETLPAVLDLAQRLRRPADIPARLAGNAAGDPKPGVRLRNVMALIETFPSHEGTRQTLRAALADGDEEVRLRSAMALGAEGWDTLQALASSEQTMDERAARALQALGDQLTAPRAKDLFAEAHRRRRPATAQACLVALGARGGPEAVETLAQALTLEEHGLAAVAARALGGTRSPEAEGLLLDALTSRPPDVLAAAAESLGRMGTVAAVMPLRAASERTGDRAFRRAARQAIAEIQARLQGAAPGQLSLAPGQVGQVSLLEDGTQGRLSITAEGDVD